MKEVAALRHLNHKSKVFLNSTFDILHSSFRSFASLEAYKTPDGDILADFRD
jgi:hypothetical protein